MPLMEAQAQKKITRATDSSFIASLAKASPCASLKAPLAVHAGAPDRASSCVLAAAAVRELQLGRGQHLGVTPVDVSQIKLVSVNGIKVDLNLSGPDDEGWWGVVIDIPTQKYLVDVRFDRATRAIKVDRCLECPKEGPRDLE